jgi:hypothetical protein
MAHYRAYFLGRDGHFTKAVDLVCEDDDSAKKCAGQMVVAHGIELWQQHRRVEKFEGRSE